jgi:hypothetical protein
MHGRGEKVYKVWVGKPEGKRLLRRPRCRWKVGIRMDVGGGIGLDWLRIGTGGELL